MAAQASHAASRGTTPRAGAPGARQPGRRHLLHLGVVAVVVFGLEGGERGVGEHGVVAPGAEQLARLAAALRSRSLTRRTISRAVTAFPFFEAKAAQGTSATSASDTQRRNWSSQTARGYLMGIQAESGIAAIAALTLGSVRTVTEKYAPARRTAPANAAEENAEPPAPPGSGAPRGAGGGHRCRGERRGAPRRSRVAAAQPGAGDHGCGQRRADRRGQRVQPPDQQAFPLDLRMAERRALLGAPVDTLLRRVDIKERHRVLAGQQRRPAGQIRQQQAAHLLQLQHVPPGERPQERAQRGRGADPPNSTGIAPCRNRSMSSMLSAPATIPATRHGTFRSAFTPHR